MTIRKTGRSLWPLPARDMDRGYLLGAAVARDHADGQPCRTGRPACRQEGGCPFRWSTACAGSGVWVVGVVGQVRRQLAGGDTEYPGQQHHIIDVSARLEV